MNSYSASVLANLNKRDKNVPKSGQSSHNSNPDNSSDLQKNIELSQANKMFCDSRLGMKAIKALPMEMEVEITLLEAKQGTKRKLDIFDDQCCVECVNLKPINRLQCEKCKGVGYIQVKRQVEINLSAGLLPDQKITFEGLGRYDFRSGKNNDLVVKIKISDHPNLSLKDKDITCTAQASLYDMVLGADLVVPTVTESAPLKLHPFTKSGEVYRLPGHGIAGGDQLVKIKLVMPQKLTGEQVSLFRIMKELADAPSSGQAALVFSH